MVSWRLIRVQCRCFRRRLLGCSQLPTTKVAVFLPQKERENMNCVVCKAEVGENKKYTVFMVDRKQLVMCKGCLMKGMQSKLGSIVTERGVINRPVLFFGSSESDLRDIAKSEGWKVTKSVIMETEPGVWFITQHWDMAQKYYFFNKDGMWGRLESCAGAERDCFRRSCQNIRDYFGVWLEAAMESTELGA